MDSVDKLRGDDASLGDLERRLSAITGCGFIGDALNVIADEIEREIAERYMELPVDADGVPIHVGDELCGYGLPNGGAVVKALNGHMVIVGRLDGGENYAKSGLLWDARETHHVKQRTLEDVLREFTDEVIEWSGYSGPVSDDTTWSGMSAKYAAEIRELLMGGDAQ